MEDLMERINLAYAKLGLRESFIAAVVGSLNREVVEDAGITACTNGVWFRFGKTFCEALDDEELFGLVYHESLHVVLMHMWRREERMPGLWNYANDAIINRLVIDRGYKLPKGGVLIDWVTEADGSEDVYVKLMQKQQQQQQSGKGQKGDGSPQDGQSGGAQGDDGDKSGNDARKGGWNNSGDIEDAPTEEAGGVASEEMEARIRAAAEMARACGDKSALVERIIGSPSKSKVRWQDEVRTMLTSSAKDDYTFKRPSRRFAAQGLCLPSLYSDAMGGLVIGFDTSGSMGPEQCNQVAGEINAIVGDLNPEWVIVVYCDAVVTRTERFERGDPVELKPKGGGGTRFAPVFAWVEKNVHDKVAGLIYLTDMEGPFSDIREPEFPVVWGNVFGREQQDVPFGHVVRVIV